MAEWILETWRCSCSPIRGYEINTLHNHQVRYCCVCGDSRPVESHLDLAATCKALQEANQRIEFLEKALGEVLRSDVFFRREDDITWAGMASDAVRWDKPEENTLYSGYRSDMEIHHMPALAAYLKARGQ